MVRNLISDVKGRTWTEGVPKRGAEEYMWTCVGREKRKVCIVRSFVTFTPHRM